MSEFKPYITHKQAIKMVAKKHGISYARAKRMIDGYLARITYLMEFGYTIKLRGLGKLQRSRFGNIMEKRRKIMKNLRDDNLFI